MARMWSIWGTRIAQWFSCIESNSIDAWIEFHILSCQFFFGITLCWEQFKSHGSFGCNSFFYFFFMFLCCECIRAGIKLTQKQQNVLIIRWRQESAFCIVKSVCANRATLSAGFFPVFHFVIAIALYLE